MVKDCEACKDRDEEDGVLSQEGPDLASVHKYRIDDLPDPRYSIIFDAPTPSSDQSCPKETASQMARDLVIKKTPSTRRRHLPLLNANYQFKHKEDNRLIEEKDVRNWIENRQGLDIEARIIRFR